MKTLRGKVSGIRHTVDVSGTQKAVSTTHLAIFDLGGKPVTLSGEAAAIDNGDEVEVAGYFRGGTFRACAFRNHTKRTSGGAPFLKFLILGAIMPMFGLMVFREFHGLDVAMFGMAFLGAGLFCIVTGIGIWRAKALLSS